jgi:hypothetical protein
MSSQLPAQAPYLSVLGDGASPSSDVESDNSKGGVKIHKQRPDFNRGGKKLSHLSSRHYFFLNEKSKNRAK